MVAYAMMTSKTVQIRCVVALATQIQFSDIRGMASFILTPVHHHSKHEVIKGVKRALQNKKMTKAVGKARNLQE